jgi:hypothetical protein
MLLLWMIAAEDRAIAYLSREVPAWFSENRCYSCHNNGDGARALFAAIRQGRSVSAKALRDSAAWLAAPGKWEQNRGDPRFSDKKLARLQFTVALGAALRSGILRDPAPLRRAVSELAADQQSDGSWRVDDDAEAGSPVTWGTGLATALVIRALEDRAAPEGVTRAKAWLAARPIRFVPDAAAALLGLGETQPAIAFLRRSRTSDGAWGPAPHAPAEPFDTALALLGLARANDRSSVAGLIAGGRSWLERAQLDSGGWPETTRPPGGQSYAQHVSTTAWCLMALLETAPPP